MKKIITYSAVLLAAVSCAKAPSASLNLSGECLVEGLSLDGYEGAVDKSASTVVVTVPKDYDMRAMSVTSLSLSEGAGADLAEGDVLNMLSPRRVRVTSADVYMDWTLSVKEDVPDGEKPVAVYMGLASSAEELGPEEKSACTWMLENIRGAQYVSAGDILRGSVDLSKCRLLWWHFHRDGGVNSKEAFEAGAEDAVSAASRLRALYRGGMSLLLTRYAAYLPAYIGAAGSGVVPNNCGGGNEDSPEVIQDPWYIDAEVSVSHPLYKGLVMSSAAGEESRIYTCPAGYSTTNSFAQWHIGTDWGGYESRSDWAEKTGAEELGRGGDGSVVIWEFKKTGSSGGIICIGSGCYDWDGGTFSDPLGYHGNVSRMTRNAIEYLTK